jgi:DNA-binding response OmpR family regulator
MKILLLDNQIGFRRALADYLTRHGYLVDAQDTTASALAALAASGDEGGEPFGLAIVEPHTNKRFLTEAQEMAPGLPILVVTGEPDWKAGVDYLTAGYVDAYLSKQDPELHDRLLSCIQDTAVRMSFDGWQVDMETYEITYHGRPIELTQMQTVIFAHFVRNPRRRIGYEEIARVTGKDPDTLAAARVKMAATMSNMRARLAEQAGYEVISSVIRMGFKIMPAPVDGSESESAAAGEAAGQSEAAGERGGAERVKV